MKRLTLVRHAQAESALGEQSDFDRVLTRRGVDDAAEMSRRLKRRKLDIDFILSSSAPRAFATAEIFARTLKLASAALQPDDRLYTAGPNDLFKVLAEFTINADHILLTAHNPSITEFADKLSGERSIDSMTTCAIVTMQLDIPNWAALTWHIGTEVELDYPGRAP